MKHMSGAIVPRSFSAVAIQNFFPKWPEVGEIFYFDKPGRTGIHIFTSTGWTRVVTHHQYISEVFIAETGQSSFTLTRGRYVTDGSGVLVFKNGLKVSSESYSEITSTLVILKHECSAGDEVEIVIVNSPAFSTEPIENPNEFDINIAAINVQLDMAESIKNDPVDPKISILKAKLKDQLKQVEDLKCQLEELTKTVIEEDISLIQPVQQPQPIYPNPKKRVDPVKPVQPEKPISSVTLTMEPKK